MKYPKRIFLVVGLFLIVVMITLPEKVSAGSAWQWSMSLSTNKAGDSMYMPSAVAFDEVNKRYYAVDTGKSRLISFDLDGKLLKAFSANQQLKSPFDMVRLDNGQLWVVEKGRNSLTNIDVKSKKIQTNTLMDGEHLVFPDRIAAFDDNLFVLDRSSGQILRLGADLSVEQRYGCSDCDSGMIDFVISEGDVFALEPHNRKVFHFKQDGTLVDEIILGDDVDFPVSLDIGASGFIYVLDRHQDSVMVFSERGKFRYSFLSSGQAAGQIYFARHLRFDPWGKLCVVDEGNGRVEIFNR